MGGRRTFPAYPDSFSMDVRVRNSDPKNLVIIRLSDKRFAHLARRAVKLGGQPFIMPIDEIELASEFAALPDQHEVVPRLIRELFDHQNMHVRRIAVNAVRRSEVFDVPGLADALTRMLTDSESWVRYDAAWAIGTAGFDSPEIRRLLAIEASNCTPEDDDLRNRSPGDADVAARVRARDVLQRLQA
jgi:hypothetical protein